MGQLFFCYQLQIYLTITHIFYLIHRLLCKIMKSTANIKICYSYRVIVLASRRTEEPVKHKQKDGSLSH